MKEDQSERLVVVGVVRRVCAATIHTHVCASHTEYTPQQQQHTQKTIMFKTTSVRDHASPARPHHAGHRCGRAHARVHTNNHHHHHAHARSARAHLRCGRALTIHGSVHTHTHLAFVLASAHCLLWYILLCGRSRGRFRQLNVRTVRHDNLPSLPPLARLHAGSHRESPCARCAPALALATATTTTHRFIIIT